MTPQDATRLAGFIARMGMYICPSDRHGVVSFLHGYELGSLGRCAFTRLLSEELAKKHRIQSGSLGWAEQVERFGKRRRIGWMEAFILTGSAVLTNALDSKGRRLAAGKATSQRNTGNADQDAAPNGRPPRQLAIRKSRRDRHR